jgi:uncharacterized RDD family membrane protein YckC
MSEQNPYSAPQADLSDVTAPAELRLGGRGARLGAVFIDGFIQIPLVLPFIYATGYFDGITRGVKPGFGMTALGSLIGFGVFLAIQGYPLATAGQTWGKKWLKLKIVDLDGRKPEFLRLVGLRYGITQLVMLIPGLGSIYALVDTLFIFRDDKRCIHDHIAGTRVVVAD